MVVVGETCGGVGFLTIEFPSKSTAIPADPMSLWKHFYLARSVDDALKALSAASGKARVIAGGTDLLLELQQGKKKPVDILVDINRIPEMTLVEVEGEWLSIGAATPLSHLIENTLIQRHAEALFESCALIGGPQVRNTATLGGNVAHALPGGDGSIALTALGAKAEIATLSGRKLVPIEHLFAGPGISAINSESDIIIRFLIPIRRTGQGSAFSRVMKAQGIALPVLNIAVWLEKAGSDSQQIIQEIRIAVGPAGPMPFRAMSTESSFLGKPLGDAGLAEAKAILRDEIPVRTSPHRATADYRRQVSGVLLERAIRRAWKRAGEI